MEQAKSNELVYVALSRAKHHLVVLGQLPGAAGEMGIQKRSLLLKRTSNRFSTMFELLLRGDETA